MSDKVQRKGEGEECNYIGAPPIRQGPILIFAFPCHLKEPRVCGCWWKGDAKEVDEYLDAVCTCRRGEVFNFALFRVGDGRLL